VGVYVDGVRIAADLIDPTTGQGALLGHFVEIGGYSPNVVLGPDGTRLYAMGFLSGSSANVLATLDLGSGTSTAVVTAQTQPYVLAGVTDDGHVIGVFWSGSFEEVDLVDPATGSGTSVGQLGDLTTWQDQLVYDRAGHVVYAWGHDTAGTQLLYSLNLDTHVAATFSVSSSSGSYPFGGVTSGGSLIGVAPWNGSYEGGIQFDPRSGLVINGPYMGTGTSTPPAGSVTYDASTRMLYAIGATSGSMPMPVLYAGDLGTGMTTLVVTAQGYTLARP
jgi:hypothetical protein